MSTPNEQRDVETIKAPKGAPPGTPPVVTRPVGAEPGPGVSNADVDLQSVGSDSTHSTYVENPDPNPDGLFPAPGPSTIEVLGRPRPAAD